ncbi:hypothetical protein IZU99_05425 [Oscillospiraceae bacterium CM]|nr:hypothetical protein IZU99_05425 [Oscillospiraceae bacterium CM]
MKYDPDIHHRHSIRLKSFDYASAASYYITICTMNRACLFGEVNVGADLVSAHVVLNTAGKMIEDVWMETIASFPCVSSPEFILMPNHLHCILTIARADTRSAPTMVAQADTSSAFTMPAQADTSSAFTMPAQADTRSAPKMTVGKIIQVFKSKSTVNYIRGINSGIFEGFEKRLWQRNYYEHIIRDEKDYLSKCNYIRQNPCRWTDDEYHAGTSGK